MSIVTLTTDLGYRDHYLAIVKAKLISQAEGIHIIDLSCEIKNNNIADAAYILKNSLDHFPPYTIHLVAIKFIMDKSKFNNNVDIDNSRYLLTKYKDQFIICPDNGLLSLIDKEFSEPVYQIYYEGKNKNHFFLKDVFVDVTLHLIQNKPIAEIAVLTEDFYKANLFESYLSGNILRGKSIYVDDFGNIITNISQMQFTEIVGKKRFSIALPGSRITRLHETYDQVSHGSPLILFNSSGYLEVAINGGSAFNLLCPRDIGASFDFNLLIEIHD